MGQSSTPMKEGYRITRGVGAHKLYTKKAKWNAVRKTCMMDGGHLVILNSLAEESVLMNLMQAANLDTIWVGAHDMFREGEWVTLTGESLERAGYEKWSTILPNQPDNHNGRENCGTLGRQGVTKPPETTPTTDDCTDGNGTTKSDDCDDDNGNGNGNGNNGSSKNPDDCDDNGNGNGNGNGSTKNPDDCDDNGNGNGNTPNPCSRHTLVLTNRTAEFAGRACRKEAGNLAVIDSREEWKVLTDLLKENNVDNAWIGGSEINLGGDQENEECEEENCPALKSTGQLSNEDCRKELPSICEIHIC
ncbi:Hemolymph lipopolysaccharide-binding protein [Dufourea novaeangliae]|uniref:Hemolymph lipopolysaccharide-binding protein n=1 Tax=Dufourea novaeangliae TaxID=178035 RepID=A0A154P736_DUFNO|nr:Hemolymph lipopolysaccharide-binding protein [Dufourea novaeangliae]